MRTKHDYESIMPIVMDIDKMKLMYNLVIVEFDPKQCEQTPGGIFAPLSSLDHEVAVDFVPRVATVVKIPKTLFYEKKNHATSMRWKTTIEIQPGDKIWMNHSTVNDKQYYYNGKTYKAINYEDIVCAKRGDRVIMCNGYVLCKPYYITKKALVFEKQELVVKQAQIEYLGTPNIEYQNPKRIDTHDLNVGDMVLFDKKDLGKIRYLESKYFQLFDGEPHIVVQSYMIAAVLTTY